MMTKIKVWFGFMVAAVVAVAAYQVFIPALPQTTATRDQLVTITVKTALIGSNPWVEWQQRFTKAQGEEVVDPVWSREIATFKGDLIAMLVTQQGVGVTECLITHDEEVVATNWMDRPGTIGCQYPVR